MRLQNRVTPFGEIVAISQRGTFTGNRGIIHDPATKTLLKRRWTTKAWLVCTCEYKDRRRAVMAGRSWTELFFLDEAVALAAGHRPCFHCRPDAAERFRDAWMAAKGGARPAAAAIDAVLHQERIERGRKRVHPIPRPLTELPDGAIVVAAGSAFTLRSGQAYRWTNDGYAPAERLLHAEGLLTPPSTLMALRAGYRPTLHPTVNSDAPHRAHPFEHAAPPTRCAMVAERAVILRNAALRSEKTLACPFATAFFEFENNNRSAGGRGHPSTVSAAGLAGTLSLKGIRDRRNDRGTFRTMFLPCMELFLTKADAPAFRQVSGIATICTRLGTN